MGVTDSGASVSCLVHDTKHVAGNNNLAGHNAELSKVRKIVADVVFSDERHIVTSACGGVVNFRIPRV